MALVGFGRDEITGPRQRPLEVTEPAKGVDVAGETGMGDNSAPGRAGNVARRQAALGVQVGEEVGGFQRVGGRHTKADEGREVRTGGGNLRRRWRVDAEEGKAGPQTVPLLQL